MQKLAFGLFAAFIVAGAFAVACGNDANNKIKFVDSNIDSSGDACNVLADTGCAPSEKCTWIADQAKPTRLGHIGCAPAGDKTVGQTCTRNSPGPMGWDDCGHKLFCRGDVDSADAGPGVCHDVCDPTDLTTCPSTGACVQYSAIFQSGSNYEAGMCDGKCNPLTDNDFLGSNGSAGQPGSPCRVTEGCYGAPTGPSATIAPPPPSPKTQFTCGRMHNTDLFHRANCVAAGSGNGGAGCSHRNDCAQGYVPLLYKSTAEMTAICVGMCEPANCFMGNCGVASANLPGKPGVAGTRHQCTNQDLRGIINQASQANDGDQCVFTWRYEIGRSGEANAGVWQKSDWSNTTGWCQDHSQYNYDSNNDGMFNSMDAVYPSCDTMPSGFGTGSAVGSACNPGNGCVAAATFGCQDTTTAGLGSFQSGDARLTNRHVRLPVPAFDTSR